jgi:hypothetical protein
MKEEIIKKNTLDRLYIILAGMGYRKYGKDWAKPFGFALIVVTVKDLFVEFASITQGKTSKLCWKKSGFAFDNETSNNDFVYSVAMVENDIHIESASSCGEAYGKVFDFMSPADLYQLDII